MFAIYFEYSNESGKSWDFVTAESKDACRDIIDGILKSDDADWCDVSFETGAEVLDIDDASEFLDEVRCGL